MAASWWKLGLALGVGAAFCALVPSCADNNQTIFIRQMQGLVAPQCTVTNDPTALQIFGGSLDLALSTSYVAYPLIGNQLIARGDTRTSRAEPNRVVLQGAEVHLLDPDGSERVPAFTVIATGTIDPTSSSDPSYGVTSIEVIPASIGVRLRNELVAAGVASRAIHAEIRVFGETLGGREVETAPYVMPIDLCYGCSVAFPAPDATTPLPVCSRTSEGTDQLTICRIGQDLATDCALCAGSIPACTPCTTDEHCAGMANALDPTQPSTCNLALRRCQ